MMCAGVEHQHTLQGETAERRNETTTRGRPRYDSLISSDERAGGTSVERSAAALPEQHYKECSLASTQ